MTTPAMPVEDAEKQRFGGSKAGAIHLRLFRQNRCDDAGRCFVGIGRGWREAHAARRAHSGVAGVAR